MLNFFDCRHSLQEVSANHLSRLQVSIERGRAGERGNSDSPPSLASLEGALGGERLLDDYAERSIETWGVAD